MHLNSWLKLVFKYNFILFHQTKNFFKKIIIVIQFHIQLTSIEATSKKRYKYMNLKILNKIQI